MTILIVRVACEICVRDACFAMRLAFESRNARALEQNVLDVYS